MSTEFREHPERRLHQSDPDELSLRDEHVVTGYLAKHRDSHLAKMVEQKKITKAESYAILTETARDPKTDVQRADLLEEILEFEMYQTRERARPMTVAILDIDDFKRINTELTHVGADEVLKKVAQTISASVRQRDDIVRPADLSAASSDAKSDDEGAVIRWGGEEFVVVLSGANLAQGHDVVDRLRERISEELRGLRPDGQPVTVSAGLTEYSGLTTVNYQDILQQADVQLMAAKQGGKNVVYPRPEQAAA